MKCPYCNHKLKPIVDNDGLKRAIYTCTHHECKKSIGMIGTEEMWVKVGNLAKIRAAGNKYYATHKTQRIAYMREYSRNNKKPQ